MILEAPFTPLKWMKDHAGMQGNEFFDPNEKFNISFLQDYMFQRLQEMYRETKDQDEKDIIIDTQVLEIYKNMFITFEGEYTLVEFWLMIRNKVVESVLLFYCLGVTKQICNRLLEPFMWHTVIITGTEWQNFFALRVHPAAEIHMQRIAELMLEEYNKSEPKLLAVGEWHIPYGETINQEELESYTGYLMDGGEETEESFKAGVITNKVKVATARCARVSYTIVGEGKETSVKQDVELHDKFEVSRPLHASPFEHCAFNNGTNEWSGNFRGFTQYRKLLIGENATDSRVIQK